MSNLINYIYVDCFEKMLKLSQLHQEDECKANVIILQNNIWEEISNKEHEKQIYKYITENNRIMILVLDCTCTIESIRLFFSFDLIYATERAQLIGIECVKDDRKLLLFMSERKKSNKLLSVSERNSDDLCNYGIAINTLSSEDIENSINKCMLSVLNDRKQVQIEAIKKCINSYKSLIINDIDIYDEKFEFVEHEMKQFCNLALIKYEEKMKNHDS